MQVDLINELPPEEFAREVHRALRKELLAMVGTRKLSEVSRLCGLEYRVLYGLAHLAARKPQWDVVVRALAPLGYRVVLKRTRHFMEWRP